MEATREIEQLGETIKNTGQFIESRRLELEERDEASKRLLALARHCRENPAAYAKFKDCPTLLGREDKLRERAANIEKRKKEQRSVCEDFVKIVSRLAHLQGKSYEDLTEAEASRDAEADDARRAKLKSMLIRPSDPARKDKEASEQAAFAARAAITKARIESAQEAASKDQGYYIVACQEEHFNRLPASQPKEEGHLSSSWLGELERKIINLLDADRLADETFRKTLE